MPKVIRDAVHGDIELGAIEMDLLDTREFQRLRGIKQLGTAHLIYPSATHTRFEHSLGASWMAHRLLQSLGGKRSVSEDQEVLVRVATLLHDVTHIPFGHTLEDERRVLPRHDQDEARLRHFLEESSLARVLERHGIATEILDILRGRGGLCSDIVAGPINADLLDYLRRDTYFCGLSQHYDDRVFHLFDEQDGRLIMNLEKHGKLRMDALSELVNLLRIRYTLTERVYFHHTKLASGAMISKALELSLASGFDPHRLLGLEDQTLLWVLRTEYAATPGVTSILDRLAARVLYKPAFVLGAAIGEANKRRLESRFHYSPAEREAAEKAIARAAGVAAHEVIVYCPSLGMSLPEAAAPARLERGIVQPLSEANNAEIRVLKEKHRALWRFLVLVDRIKWDSAERVRRASEEVLGLPSE